MTTYWTVVLMVTGAALLVVLAIWFQIDPGGRRRNRRWVALGSSGTAGPGQRSWVASIVTDRPAEAIDLTTPGATLADLRSSQLGPALAANPSVAVIWLGAGDLLHGLPLTTFQRELSGVVGQLQRHGCQVLLVALPSFRVGSERSGRRHGTLCGAIRQWQAAIDATARLTGLTLVSPGSDLPAGAVANVSGPVVWFDEAVLSNVGHRISPALDRMLGSASSWTAGPDQWDEPADPVVRRRLGLPPVR